MADNYNPADYTVDQVNDFLDEHPDQKEAVLAAEAEGEARKGILEGRHGTPEDEPEETEPQGLATTGNPNDLATKPDNTDAKISHQEGAPEALTKVADKAVEDGFLGAERERPDYSQANPTVMNQEG